MVKPNKKSDLKQKKIWFFDFKKIMFFPTLILIELGFYF